MPKQLFASLLAGCLLYGVHAAEDFSGKLPKLEGTPLTTTWNGPAVAAQKGNTYTLAAVLPKDMIHYAAFKTAFAGDLSAKALRFTISSTTPAKSRALYVRAFDSSNKCVASWKTWNSPVSQKPTVLTFVPERKSHGMDWEDFMVKSPGKTIAKLEFIIGHRGTAGTVYDVQISNIELCDIPKEAKVIKPVNVSNLTSQGFEILGIPAKSAELRGSIAFMHNGHHYVLSRPQDHGKTGYLLLSDLDSGKTEQFFNPPEVRQGDNFGSILTSKGHFLYDQAGANVVLFDVNTKQFRNLGRPEPLAQHFMVYTEAPDGTVYLGGYPRSTITAWNPETGKFRNYGRMDPKESYLNQIATDKNGYVYCGIGSARANLVALDPKTGKVTQILPENMRALGYGNAVSGVDGYAYLSFGKFTAKMLDGKIVATGVTIPPARKILAAKYGGRLWRYEDGTQVSRFDLYKKVITYQGLDGKNRDIPFDYQSGGLYYTSLGSDGKSKIFGSTCHPMHFVEYNDRNNKITDHGPHSVVSGGNFCNMTYDKNGIVYLCEYAGGRLWKFDPAQPYDGGAGNRPVMPNALSVQEMHKLGKVTKGHFTVVNPHLLLCFGEDENAKFVFPMKVTKSGKTFVNILAYEHGIYGTATFEFQGKSKKVNLQNVIDRTKLVVLDSVDLKEGTYPLTITVRSHGGSSRPMIGLLGISVTTDKEFVLPKKVKNETNPQILGAWPQAVTRPRAVQVHPDGKHVVISGYAGYGLCGGSFGIHNLETKKNTQLSDWLPGHSCITFRFADNGDIIGGTDVAAPGGGHTVATKPAIFRIDWKTKKVLAYTEFAGANYVMAVELWNGDLYAALSDGRLVVADAQTMQVKHTFAPNYKGVPVRNALMKTADNRLFFLQQDQISEFHPKTGAMVPLCRPTQSISAAGAILNGYIYFACHVHYARWKIPAPLK